MKSKQLLEEIMRLDNIVDVKIYRINNGVSESNDFNIQQGFNDYIKETINSNSRKNKTNYLFL